MRTPTFVIAALVCAFAVSQAAAQGSLRGTAHSKSKAAAAAAEDDTVAEDEAPAEEEEAPKAKPKKRKADGKGMVEEYLRDRLTVAQKNHHDQKAFGAKVTERWDKFFQELFDDRKRFETSIARQRLNLFETLTSVGPGYREQAVSDFERMQGTMLKSFEGSQKQKMDEFFGGLLEDYKGYFLDQDKKRAELVASSVEAWKDQRVVTEAADKAEKAEKADKKKKSKEKD